MKRRLMLIGLWLAFTAVAVAAGVFAVSTVGATIRDRGPVGDEVVRDVDEGTDPPATVEPTARGPRVREEVTGEWGTFVVDCRDTWAYGIEVRPATGWKTVRWEQGPDDDVAAVFTTTTTRVELEIFCNRGRPDVAELERNTLGDD